MKLIVGLGNPGNRYQFNRHNIGFMVVDALATLAKGGDFRQEHKALTLKTKVAGSAVLLAKPQTFMNLSGESVRALMDFYKVSLADLLVIQDDIDQPFAQLRFHIQRGHGGHNGIRSLHQILGTDQYARLKLGVGRPADPRFDVADYVLADFSAGEQTSLSDFLSGACEATDYFVAHGVEKAANHYNSRGPGE